MRSDRLPLMLSTALSYSYSILAILNYLDISIIETYIPHSESIVVVRSNDSKYSVRYAMYPLLVLLCCLLPPATIIPLMVFL